MIKTVVNTKNINEADVVLISAAYEKTASSHKGTAQGPQAIIQSLDHQIEFFDRKYKVEVNDLVKTAHVDLGNINEFSPEEVFDVIKEKYKDLISKDKFIFVLGGEHSVSIGALEALTEKYDPKDVTILQIDAHCDLREDDSDYSDTPSSLAHSTVMRHASMRGYHLVQIGIRTYSKEEYEFFSDKKNNVTVWEWGRKIPTIEEILASIKTKYVYLSIDADGFDPSFMPGTGTPVQGGLEWWYGVELIEEAIKRHDLIGADIVEVSPIEGSVVTEYGAAQLCYSIIAAKFQKRFK